MYVAAKRLLGRIGLMGAVALLVLPTAPAHAVAILPFGATTQCFLYTGGFGSGQPFGCDSSGWTTGLGSFAGAEMRMTVHYLYIDDGLPLDAPTFLQTSSSGDGQWVTHEAAAMFGPGTFQSFVSANDVPDRISGTLTFSVSAFNSTFEPTSVTLSIHPQRVLLSAVPEPSTYAMMIVPLALIGLAARRRRARQGL